MMDTKVAETVGSIALGKDVGSFIGNTLRDNDKEWKRQKKVLQNQVQWRVDDAVKAGLHPLAALGLNPASYSPGVSVGDSGFDAMGSGGVLDRLLNSSPEATNAQSLLRESLQNELLQAQIGLTRAQTASSTAAGTAMIGNTKVKDPEFAQKTQNAWGDWVEGILGAMRFMEDSWKSSMGHSPIGKGPLGLTNSTLPPAEKVQIMDLPRGGLY